ncbi:hypothetical protein Ae406Ps2_4067 [Pseudonocardia sp. Ae406_Ps2]|nr:hypothetical protein Ae331Ps2_1891c [Pseudonocardia sp. Ae331_Ps2]OLM04064.1 hypothetical protein Ae406Ps2_4064 [Pseudonocardia sp. Ae406_Ps2]OLM04067.1 hypothetical protein Ae406Ps2_4067 [Pseudonocardia sp. Ae406_Ps2]OLM25612.1 hypothetical protein Ae706Ps2_4045 [Pseudonocardia sp. Ae706_Ps2]
MSSVPDPPVGVGREAGAPGFVPSSCRTADSATKPYRVNN